eukprot:snap_masked-scaffold_45-processed-gene-1.67-mRNA-1 protein AED:1.00 eAED:1.00 QI:0/-1/0/0/-1/1/1/0/529
MSPYSMNKTLKIAAKLFLVYKVYKFILQVIEAQRKKSLLLKLPHVPTPEAEKNSLHIYGAFKVADPENFVFTHKYMQKNFLSLAKKVSQELLPNPPLIANFIINPRFTVYKFFGTVLLNDIDVIRESLSTKLLPKFAKGVAYEVSSPLIGSGVLSTSGPIWHSQRITLDKGFTQELISKQFPMVVKTAKELVIHLKGYENKEINLIEPFLKTTLDVLGRVAFSYDIGSLTNPHEAPLYDAFENILDTLQQRVRTPHLHWTSGWPTKQNIEFNACLNKLNQVVKDIIKQRKGDEKENNRDLLDILLGGDMKEARILDNMRTIMFAGHDTTAAGISWSIYLLAKNKGVQRKIMEEFEDICGGNLENVSIENLEKMDFLNAVVLEVLRLYPSAGFTKTVVEDVELGGYTIPKGIDVLYFPYLIHRNPKYYSNPDDFQPERWLDTEKETGLSLQARLAKATREKAYFPFSLGKRNCVGRKLALLEIRVIILYILKEFIVDVANTTSADFQEIPWIGLTLYPVDVYASLVPKGI